MTAKDLAAEIQARLADGTLHPAAFNAIREGLGLIRRIAQQPRGEAIELLSWLSHAAAQRAEHIAHSAKGTP